LKGFFSATKLTWLPPAHATVARFPVGLVVLHNHFSGMQYDFQEWEGAEGLGGAIILISLFWPKRRLLG